MPATKKKASKPKAAKKVTAEEAVGAAEKSDSKSFIKKWFDDKGMSQIYSTGLEFAFVSAKGEQCHPFAYCKDFLQDAIWAEINKSTATIYGFVHKSGVNPPVDLEVTRLAVRLKGKRPAGEASFRTMCEATSKYLLEVDAAFGFEPSKLIYGGKYKDGADDVFICEGDVRWMYSPVMISLYSLVIRIGMTYKEGDWQAHFATAAKYVGRNDKRYAETAKKALDKLVGKKMNEVFADEMPKNYPAGTGTLVAGMHGSSGVVAFGNGRVSANLKEHWNTK